MDVATLEVRLRESRPAAAAALAWLAHPVTCVALVLLVVNDQVLKAAYGTWWTGKLSDVAWLVIAPPLLATIVAGVASCVGVGHLSARSGTRASLAVVGVVFVVVKATAVGAGLASAALTALAGPSLVLADPADLVALPALALAWAVARATRTREPSRRRLGARAPIRWLVVLPVAVLATCATSQVPPTGTMEITVADGVLIVADSSGPGTDGANWYLSEDGSSWDAIYSWSDKVAGADVVGRFTRAGGTARSACVRASPLSCFRSAEQGVGVDRSDDGGRTWRADWSIPDDVLPELAGRYGPEGAALRTVGVAILPSPDGFRVYAADGGDGLAVRDERGTWQRIGFAYRTNAPPVVPLPGDPTPMAYPLPWSVPLGVPAALIAFALSGRGSGRRPARLRVLGGRWVALGAASVSALAVLANVGWGAVNGQEVASDLTLGSLVSVAIVGALTILAAVLSMVAATLLRGGRTAGLVAVVGFGVALILGLVQPLALAGAVAVAFLGAGVAVSRRESREPDPG